MVDIGDLSKEITQALSEYTTEVEEGLEEAKLESAKQTVKNIKQNVESAGFVLTGDYKKGWTKKKTRNGYVVYNRTDYQLTHLLEYGHAKRGGGRVPGKPHIRPAEEQMIEDYTNAVEKVIK